MLVRQIIIGRRQLSSSLSRLDTGKVASLLASGGDGRVTITKLEWPWSNEVVNSYGTTTTPRPDVIERSSCTSSSPSPAAFEAASKAMEAMTGPNGFEDDRVRSLLSSNRLRIAKVLGLGEDDAVLTCDSGTSAEIWAALVGLSRATFSRGEQETVARKAAVLTVLMPGTGSGVAEAASLRAHSTSTPTGRDTQPGEAIAGIPDGLVKSCEPIRDGVDASNAEELEAYVRSKRSDEHVLLHVVSGSKTGIFSPPLHVAEAVRDALGGKDACTLVVDCCQMRVAPGYVSRCLRSGHVVLVTGSKFYGGPPFCGAALLPRDAARDLESAAGDSNFLSLDGVADYLSRDDLPESMTRVGSKLPGDKAPNAGLAARWAAALAEMERFANLGTDRSDAFARRWVSRVRALAEGFYPQLEILDVEGSSNEHRLAKVNTVVSLLVRGDSKRLLNVKDLKIFCRLVASDLSSLCGQGRGLPEEAKDLASKKIQLGQPVLLGNVSHGCVRLALGSALVVDSLPTFPASPDDDASALDRLAVQDVVLFRKLELVANHWSLLAERVASTALSSSSSTTSDDNVVNVDVSWLKPHERVVNQERVDALVEAITRWGEYRKPLLVDKDSGSILDGHHRFYAAQKLGLAKVPAALVDYLNDEDIMVDVWPGDHGVTQLTKQDVIDMCLSADVFPPKTSKHTFAKPLDPINVPLEDLR